MYFQALDAAAEIRGELIGIARPTGITLAGLKSDYARALKRACVDMPLSERGSAEYAEIRRARREDLEAILLSGMPDESMEKARDLICAICEESGWSEKPETPFEDDMHPTIDFMAAETACLLGWAKRAERLDARTESRMLFEARKRVFTPLFAHEDYACLKGAQPSALATLCEAMAAALLLETDGPRLYAFLRRAARAADELIEKRALLPLSDALTGWAAATALWTLARDMAGALSLGKPLPRGEWLDALLIAHVGGSAFLDPAGAGMRAGMNGADVYLLGESAQDSALCALGAQLYRANPEKASAVTSRLYFDLPGGILDLTGSAPRLKHAALPDGSLMSARGGGMHVLMHAGGRGNAGGVCVYIENAPVLATAIRDGATINHVNQLEAPGLGDCEFGETRADMTMDMTALYPGAGVRFCQRTLLFDRAEGSARLVDIVESAAQGSVTFRFATPHAPIREKISARLGVGLLMWEGAPEVQIRKIEGGSAFPGGLNLLELTYPVETGTNLFHFTIERA